MLVSGVAAVGVTGVSVAGGVVAGSSGATTANLTAGGQSGHTVDQAQTRAVAKAAAARVVVSRSDRRAATDPAKASLLSGDTGPATAREENLDTADPRDIAKALLPEYGFSSSEFSCLDPLYTGESGWRVDADNPSSSAYGIPQALTATHDMPEGYMTSAEVQIRWGLEYIANRYGTPCSAWGFKQGHGWY